MFKTILAAVGAGFICFKIYEVGYKRGVAAATVPPAVKPAEPTAAPVL